MKKYQVLIGIVLAVMIGAFWIISARPAKAPPTPACTTEAKMCPDGSAVGRTGPNCEFAACPSAPAPSTPVSTTPKPPATVPGIAIGANAMIGGVTIGVLELVEDSRCPVDVQCIWAGRVRVRASIDAYNRDFTFTLGEPQEVGDSSITLTSVLPVTKRAQETVKPSEYRFIFSVVSSGIR